ncbi:Aste57867_14991 [Aphanomyces stellatus]|uniref:Aste57867_14991 protein n=1 Tax=Aphanomyces stellatus TaxID=120398 RepID=A0A485L3W4_9STRA|nr:hypothetical protein As57867_014935 [Aphanomyces stellatus]VFT91805.1 Aste57867_14991 [Aphanomyces stellatus]
MNVVRARPPSRQSKDADFIPSSSGDGSEPIKYCIRRVTSDPQGSSAWANRNIKADDVNNNHEEEDSTGSSSSRDMGRSIFAAIAEYNETQSFSSKFGPRTSESMSNAQDYQSEGMPEFTTGGRFKDSQFQTKSTSRFSNFFRRRRSITATDTSAISRNDIYMQGYLSKQGSWRKNWKTRYFILRIDEPSLVYCDSEENREVLGQVPITKDTTVLDMSTASSKPTFEVQSPQRKLLLEAASMDDLKHWLDAIQETIDLVSSRLQEDEDTMAFQPRMSPEVRISASKDDALSIRSSTTYSATGSDDATNVLDLRVELLLDMGKDRMAYYVLLEGLEKDCEFQSIAQTDIFRSPDTNQSSLCRHAFTFLLPLHPDKYSELKFSLFRAPQADDVAFGKSAFAVGAIDMATFVPAALGPVGMDLMLQPAKKDRLGVVRNNLTASNATRQSRRSIADESDGGLSLHIAAFAPDKRLVVGLPETTVVTAHRKYVMPTTVAPCGIVVVESLSVPKATFAMPIAYLQFLVDDLDTRMRDLKQTVDAKKLPPILAQYAALQEDARAHVGFLSEEAKGRAHFKRSTYKKKKEWAMVATNLHLQTMQVYNGHDMAGAYTTITMGAAAVHTKGFANGGGSRLKETLHEVLQEANRLRRPRSKEQDPLTTFELFHMPVGLLSSASATSTNKSYDPVSVARKAWFELEMRHHSLCIQVLSATAAQIGSMLELATSGSIYHTMVWRVVMRNNLLMSFESLLSTSGNEGGMLEDFHMACKWLEQVVFSFQVSANPSEPVGYKISRDANYLLHVVVRIPVSLSEALPMDLATGKRTFRVLAVLFTQGVNEMQSLAHAMHSAHTQIQDAINQDSLGRLKHYYTHFKTIKFDKLSVPDAGYGSPFHPDIPALDAKWAAMEQNILQTTKQHKKNVQILMTTSEFCRLLGGGRATCCKSGKDRTAMSVTLEQARILATEAKAVNVKHMIETMRLCGVRRENVFKNIQSYTYAFNELQRKLLPECYKPPVGTYKKGTT